MDGDRIESMFDSKKRRIKSICSPCFSRDAVPATQQAGACDVDPCEAYELPFLRSW